MIETIKLEKFSAVDLSDVFFDSLKSDYPGFEEWFKRKADSGEEAYVQRDEFDQLQAFLYLKVEEGAIEDVTPVMPPKRRLKIGTFKVNGHNTRVGERFFKKAFDFAITTNVEEIYVTIFDRTMQKPLIQKVKNFGFQEYGKKGEELVFVKSLQTDWGNPEKDYPLVHRRNRDKYVLSIKPSYHSRLFPDSSVRGEKYDIVCKPPYSSFFQRTRGLFYYDAYFTAPKKSTLLTLPKSDNAISAVFEYEKGKIVVLPRPYVGENYKTEAAWKKYGKKYLDALFELNHALMACEDSYSLPLWADGIKILDEEDQEKKLEQDLTKLESVKAEIAKREALINQIRRKKILLAASGTTLEEVVKETLQEIGFTLHEAEVGRSDIIASYDGVDVVAEIKGVSKSAAEKHAAQLEKWVAQFIEEKGRSPKALLIVNGYCDTPLSERTEEVFPDQMLKYCKSREHALITTTQLLCLYIEIKDNPECAKERITEMLSCVGKYSRYLDYKKYLRLIEREEDNADERTLKND